MSPALLLVPQPSGSALLPVVLTHLTVLVTFGAIVAFDLRRYLDGPWFPSAGAVARNFGAAAAVVALATGVVALVTLASSAALRFDVSLQFLQLLSALDIAWAAAGLGIGAMWRWGPGRALAAVATLIGVCVWSIARYLHVVGFGPSGEWVVDGGALMRHVLPYDVAAALAAILVLVAGARRISQATLQASAQS